jgi:hypothetical protein
MGLITDAAAAAAAADASIIMCSTAKRFWQWYPQLNSLHPAGWSVLPAIVKHCQVQMPPCIAMQTAATLPLQRRCDADHRMNHR